MWRDIGPADAALERDFSDAKKQLWQNRDQPQPASDAGRIATHNRGGSEAGPPSRSCARDGRRTTPNGTRQNHADGWAVSAPNGITVVLSWHRGERWLETR